MFGFIALHRQITENELWLSERFTRAQAWIDLLLLANYKQSTIFIRGNEVHIVRGELCYSMVSLASRWKWNRRTVDSFLTWLEKRQMIHSRKNHITTVITILNYSLYQDTTQQTAQRSSSRMLTNKNDNNGKQPNDPAVGEFLSVWCTAFHEQFKEKYAPNYGRDGAIVKGLLAVYSLEILVAKMKLFFQSSDEWLQKHGYTIPIFRGRINSLRVADVKKKSSDAATTTEILLERANGGHALD
jgi:hypothetical protein